MAETTAFEEDQIGAAPKGWTATLTGKGSSKWTVEIDEATPPKPRVLKQSGQATFPLLLKDDTSSRASTAGSVSSVRTIGMCSDTFNLPSVLP